MPLGHKITTIFADILKKEYFCNAFLRKLELYVTYSCTIKGSSI